MRYTRRGLVVAVMTISSASSLSAQGPKYYEQTYLRAEHNWAFRDKHPNADRLFNAFDYGHAILYETLWRQPTAQTSELDDKQFRFITTDLLVRPPRVMLDESAIGPEWVKLAPEAVMMFEWAHMLHRQLYDVWADDRISPAQKDERVAQVVRYYKSRPALAFSSKPKDMDLMEAQPYSLAFKKKFPKYNGLIWSYHWLQMTLYDALMAGRTFKERQANVTRVVGIFQDMTKAPATLPAVMPMSAAIAPMFSDRYPEAAIIFDNLHSMHDVVSDILANPLVPRDAKRKTILEAAARYRDDHTLVTTVSDWRDMARDMGAARMGGRPSFGTHPADSSKTPERHQ
ncbi:MAG TPA: hypothetical protein VM053_03140 [Gemmatimonadaceae bacterium]|nr:hypothetical protein [Gemmatimonadaceae bacterium]